MTSDWYSIGTFELEKSMKWSTWFPQWHRSFAQNLLRHAARAALGEERRGWLKLKNRRDVMILNSFLVLSEATKTVRCSLDEKKCMEIPHNGALVFL